MRFAIDLTTVPELKPIPESVVLLKAVDVKAGKSQSGNDKLTYECEILEPPEIVEQVEKYYLTMPLAEGALFRMKNLFDVCDALTPGEFDDRAIIGKTFGVIMDVEITEEYGVRNRETKFLRASKTKAKKIGDWPEAEDEGDGATPATASEAVGLPAPG
jgi:hypothetical protein